MKSVKENFEINIEDLSNEEMVDVLYYNILLAIVSELKLDKYFVNPDSYENGNDIQNLVGMSFRFTLDEKVIRDVVEIKSPGQIWEAFLRYCSIRESENIQMVILIDELIEEFSLNNLNYDQEVIKKFYITFKNYIMSKPEELTPTGRRMKPYSEKVKNVDLNINWERVDYLFSSGESK
jgi:hypothetical protein